MTEGRPGDLDQRTVEEIRRKAERMRRARADRSSFWISLARTGAVGWQLVLPLAAGVLAGRALARATGLDALALLGLLLGLVFGLWGAARAIHSALEPPEERP